MFLQNEEEIQNYFLKSANEARDLRRELEELVEEKMNKIEEIV
jgi:hypothetical protein